MLSPDPLLIDAIIWCESRGNANAVSPAGAQGLMQLMPATGREWCKRLRLGRYDPFNAEQNRTIGTAYYHHMTHIFAGHHRLALAAYNWGPGNMMKLVKSRGWDYAALENELPRETRNYVKDVLAKYCALADQAGLDIPCEHCGVRSNLEAEALDGQKKA